MGDVVRLTIGRTRRARLPHPRECDNCGELIETARLQLMPSAVRCVECEHDREERHRRVQACAGENDIVIIRGR